MQKALYPGTFDPPNLGHIDLIIRASKLVGQLIVGVGHNRSKGQSLLSIKQRIDTLKKATHTLSNVEVMEFTGLVTTFAKQEGALLLIRGVRSSKDLEVEVQMASANREVSGIETLFIAADPRYAHISSTLIRELASYGAPLKAFIPGDLEKILQYQKES